MPEPNESMAALLDSLEGFHGLQHDPARLARAVNLLWSSGEQAIPALEEYLRVSGVGHRPENTLLCARVLFVPKSAGVELPRLNLGVPDVRDPGDGSRFPLFPVAVWRDIPFVLVAGYRAGGEAESPLRYLERARLAGVLRAGPLRPDNDPLGAVDDFLSSDLWHRLGAEPWHESMVRLQALRAVAPVYPTPQTGLETLQESTGARWVEHRKNFAAAHIVWNESANEYKRG